MTNRSKLILITFLFFMVALVYFYVPYAQLEKNVLEKNMELMELEMTYDLIMTDLSNESFYLSEIANQSTRLDDLAKQLPQNLPQEYTIYLVHDMENILGMAVEQFTMTDEMIHSVYAPESGMGGEETAIFAEFETQVELTYAQLRDLLSYVYDNPYEMVLTDLTLNYTPETGMIDTRIHLTSYGLRIEGREPTQLPLEDYPLGKPIIFEPYEAYRTDFGINYVHSEWTHSPADFSITLAAYDATEATIRIGETQDTLERTVIESNSPLWVAGEMRFFQEESGYYVQYRLPDAAFPAGYISGYAFSPNESIVIEVNSSSRARGEDGNGLILTLINETDIPVVIQHLGQEADPTRLQLITQGEVMQ